MAHGLAGEIVQRKEGVAGEALEEAVFDHAQSPTAATQLLSGLEDQVQGAAAGQPLLTMLAGQGLGSTQ